MTAEICGLKAESCSGHASPFPPGRSMTAEICGLKAESCSGHASPLLLKYPGGKTHEK
jgi:hypothetical protein